jgi:hypothetical protein
MPNLTIDRRKFIQRSSSKELSTGILGKISRVSAAANFNGARWARSYSDCLRTRNRPSADIQYGHQHAVATIMAAAALETGKRHTYDRDQRVISAS